MIKVTALTSGRNAPARRYRVKPFIEPLLNLGIEVAEYAPPSEIYLTRPFALLGLIARLPGIRASRSRDITWIQRSLLVGRHSVESLTGGKRVLDVDDAIWLLSNRPYSERIAESCTAVIAGNDFLADHYRNLGARVFVLPTCVDTELWRPTTEASDSKWTVGWIGTSSNFGYLRQIEAPLAHFLMDFPESELLIVSNQRPAFENHKIADRVRFVKWNADREVELVQSMNVGLMPLTDTPWARGKCALKMIGYMAAGRPVIGSPFGVNSEIFREGGIGWPALTDSDWYEALRQSYLDRSLAHSFGLAGRRVVETKYSVQRNVTQLAEIFRTVMDN